MVDFILDMDDIQTGLHWIKERLRSSKLVLNIYDLEGWVDLKGALLRRLNW